MKILIVLSIAAIHLVGCGGNGNVHNKKTPQSEPEKKHFRLSYSFKSFDTSNCRRVFSLDDW